MTDLQNSLNPTDNLGTEQTTPVSANTEANLQTAVEPNTITSSIETSSPASPISAQINNGISSTATPNTSTNASVNQILQNNRQIQNTDAANKEKLMQVLKSERLKGKKVGFTRGILSGVLITLLVAVAGIIFAKDQVIDILSDERLDFLNLKASIVGLTDNQNINNDNADISIEEISEDEIAIDEETSDDSVVDEETSDDSVVDEETSDDSVVDEETSDDSVVDEETSDDSVVDEETSDDSVVDEETSDDAVVDEETSDDAVVDEETSDDAVVDEETSDDSVVDEETSDDSVVDENEVGYTLKHVNSPEEANWVLSPSCDNALCENDIDSIVLCNEFRENPNLNDDAKRTGKSGICRYKDISELAYIEFN